MAKLPCGCCAGIEAVTPESVVNPPGQPSLRYRVGTHATFLETMKARLTGADRPELAPLRARDGVDSSIAFLDGWACIADVLSFYQERIANEGYLRTATERFSIVELGRLVGYRPRPGVAATVFLAYQMEAGFRGVIPEGTRAQSLPAQKQLPQSFETAEALEARAEWNDLAPRRTKPQRLDSGNAFYVRRLLFQGTALNLQSGAPLLLTWGDGREQQVLRFVEAAEPDSAAGTTTVALRVRLTAIQLLRALNDLASHAAEDVREYPAVPGSPSAGLLAALADALEEAVRPLAAGQVTDEAVRAAGQLFASGPFLNRGEILDRVRRLAPDLVGWWIGFAEEWGDALESLHAGCSDPVFRGKVDDIARGTGPFLPVLTDEGDAARSRAEAAVEGKGRAALDALRRIADLSVRLEEPPSVSPRTAFGLRSSFGTTAEVQAESGARLLSAFANRSGAPLFTALARAAATPPPPVTAYALRVTSTLFGHDAQHPVAVDSVTGEVKPTANDWNLEPEESRFQQVDGNLPPNVSLLYLEREFPEIAAGDWAVVQTDPLGGGGDGGVALAPDAVNNGGTLADDGLRFARIGEVRSGISRAAYNLSGKTTALWLTVPDRPGDPFPWRLPRVVLDASAALDILLENVTRFESLRRTVVYTRSEPLALAGEPIRAPVSGDRITLDALYEGLAPGRRIVVTGERADLPVGKDGETGVQVAEVAMVAGVEQGADPKQPGDVLRTTLVLSAPLAYSYRRATAVVHGNVARATHGETRVEILGSGDASSVFQRFTPRQSPLTYVSSPNPSGAESTLQLYVDDVSWHESAYLSGAGPDDRTFTTFDDEGGVVTTFFGDGEHGARLPTGRENVRAVYRTGIGKPGNAAAGQVNQLASRPLGVKSVVNPVAATGGADADPASRMRRHIPESLASLERLISVSDYAAFARVFAGVGKASAARLADGRRMVLQVTVAGDDDIPLDPAGDLLRNLSDALHLYGDPIVALSLRRRERVVPFIAAKVKILPDYLWEKVAPAIRSALYDAFSFEARELGESLFAGEVLAVVQAVPGVGYVDLDTFTGLSETDAKDPKFLADFLAGLGGGDSTPDPDAPPPPDPAPDPMPEPPSPYFIWARPDRVDGGTLLPAQVAYLDPDLPETLVLNPIP